MMTARSQNSSREDWSYGRERYRRAVKKTGLTEGPLEENLSLVAVLDTCGNTEINLISQCSHVTLVKKTNLVVESPISEPETNVSIQ